MVLKDLSVNYTVPYMVSNKAPAPGTTGLTVIFAPGAQEKHYWSKCLLPLVPNSHSYSNFLCRWVAHELRHSRSSTFQSPTHRELGHDWLGVNPKIPQGLGLGNHYCSEILTHQNDCVMSLLTEHVSPNSSHSPPIIFRTKLCQRSEVFKSLT